MVFLARGFPFLRFGSGFGTPPRVATRLLLCSLCSILCECEGMPLRLSCNSLSILVVVFASFNARLLVPGLWVVWFPWVVPLVGLVACALVVGFSHLLSLVAYARVVGGVWFVSPLPGVWAWVFFGWFACWPCMWGLV